MWNKISRFLIEYRLLWLLFVVGVVTYLGFQTKNIKRPYKEASLLPDHDTVTVRSNEFRSVFGKEDNLIVFGTLADSILTPSKFSAWKSLIEDFKKDTSIATIFSFENIQTFQKDTSANKFVLLEASPITEEILEKVGVDNALQEIYNYPFYDGLLYNKETKTIRTAIFLKPEIVDTKYREVWVDDFLTKIKQFEKENGVNLHISGMPVIRTQNAQVILSEVNVIVVLSLVITLSLFYFFFKSFAATFISFVIVLMGVVCVFGTIGAFGFEMSILTMIIPPLVIVIGIPNCIFLINKYQQEYFNHQNKIKSLQRTITKVGQAILLTNFTTAFGFLTFIFTDSQILNEFGIIASLNILLVFLLSFILIPIFYFYLPPPGRKSLKHLELKWVKNFLGIIMSLVKYHRSKILIGFTALFVISMIGFSQVEKSGNLLDDMPKGQKFYKDILFFDENFGGILPIEIMIDTKKPKGIQKLSTLKRMDKLTKWIDENPDLSTPVSIVDMVKFTKQAYYNGNPKFYELPTTQEKRFILNYLKNSDSGEGILNNYSDSLSQKTHITIQLGNLDTDEMGVVFEDLNAKIKELFPEEKYETFITGPAYIYYKGTDFFVKNIYFSLGLAALIIALAMFFVFRSGLMVMVAMITNLFPLIVTAGIMGYFGIDIKPSTVLVFSISFGIAVDDTIHFLAKYMQQLKINKGNVRLSVFEALRDTGTSMFYTSMVLFFGFLVFLFSSFGGTNALGVLVSVTLVMAMLTDLLLLPAILLTLAPKINSKKFEKRNK